MGVTINHPANEKLMSLIGNFGFSMLAALIIHFRPPLAQLELELGARKSENNSIT
jgi:hypothetical protein